MLERNSTVTFPGLTRSKYQLEYQQAQDVLEGRSPRLEDGSSVSPADVPQLQRNLQTLARLAAHLRAGRLRVLRCPLAALTYFTICCLVAC